MWFSTDILGMRSPHTLSQSTTLRGQVLSCFGPQHFENTTSQSGFGQAVAANKQSDPQLIFSQWYRCSLSCLRIIVRANASLSPWGKNVPLHWGCKMRKLN